MKFFDHNYVGTVEAFGWRRVKHVASDIIIENAAKKEYWLSQETIELIKVLWKKFGLKRYTIW